MPFRLFLAGVSTRAAAESAARAGFDVTAVDAFGDLDQHQAVHAVTIHPFTTRAVARAAKEFPSDAVAYLSSFENHPSAVAALADGRALWGNPPAVLRSVRNPPLVWEALNERGIRTPAVWEKGSPPEPGVQWLIKPRASGGGHRVRLWERHAPVPRRSYLQEFVDGTPGSVVFVAAGGQAVPLGISRQLIGDTAFGSKDFRYCGNILAGAGDVHFERDAELAVQACALARAVAEVFQLVGVNGVDFIARDAVPHAVEVNPRWSASMELVERAYGLSVFDAHANACRSAALPAFDLLRVRRDRAAVGKAIVFARRDVIVGATHQWLADPNVRDIPRPGGRIRAGSPVCTVFAEGSDSMACYRGLVARADGIYAALYAWECTPGAIVPIGTRPGRSNSGC